MKLSKEQTQSLTNKIISKIQKNREQYNSKLNTHINRQKALHKLYKEYKPMFIFLEKKKINSFTIRFDDISIIINNHNLADILLRYESYSLLFHTILELKSLAVKRQDIIDDINLTTIAVENIDYLINKIVNKYE